MSRTSPGPNPEGGSGAAIRCSGHATMTRGLQTTGMVLATALLASCLSEPDDGERLTGIDASAGQLDQDERYDFDGYWSRFRDAVIGGDAAGVAALTHFPLSVRSVLDDAGERSVDRDDFLPLLSVLLEQDAGIEEQPRSLRDVDCWVGASAGRRSRGCR